MTQYKQRCSDCGKVVTTSKDWDISGCCNATAETLSQNNSKSETREQ